MSLKGEGCISQNLLHLGHFSCCLWQYMVTNSRKKFSKKYIRYILLKTELKHHFRQIWKVFQILIYHYLECLYLLQQLLSIWLVMVGLIMNITPLRGVAPFNRFIRKSGWDVISLPHRCTICERGWPFCTYLFYVVELIACLVLLYYYQKSVIYLYDRAHGTEIENE